MSSLGHRQGELDSDVNKFGSHQGKGWEYSFPLTDSWTKIVGIRKADIGVSSDGQVFSISAPGPIKGRDLAHVAWAAATGGARLSDEPSPLAAAVQGIEEVEVSGKVQVFPYLQLVPPHCYFCRCWLLYGTSGVDGRSEQS